MNDPIESAAQRVDAAAVSETADLRPSDPSEEEIVRLELIVSYLLRFGVALSLTITFVGLMLLLFTDPANAVIRLTGGFVPRSPWTVFAGLRLLRPKAIIDFGLILLIVTPVFRVAVTAIIFIVERDWTYTAITLFVLAVLLTSFFLGQVG